MNFNKYRIVEIGDLFYPQERFLFIFWKAMRSSELHSYNGGYGVDTIYRSYKSAYTFIELESIQRNKNKIIHKF